MTQELCMEKQCSGSGGSLTLLVEVINFLNRVTVQSLSLSTTATGSVHQGAGNRWRVQSGVSHQSRRPDWSRKSLSYTHRCSADFILLSVIEKILWVTWFTFQLPVHMEYAGWNPPTPSTEHKPHEAPHLGHKAPQLVQPDTHTHWKTCGFLFSSQRISKSLILGSDNYPCCSLMAHLHNHHQLFTEDTQRIIMRQQRNKKHLREPLKTGTERAVTAAWRLATKMPPKRKETRRSSGSGGGALK